MDIKNFQLSFLKLANFNIDKKQFLIYYKSNLYWLFEMLVNKEEQTIRQLTAKILMKILTKNDIEEIENLKSLFRKSIKELQLACVNIFEVITYFGVNLDLSFITGF